MLFGLRIGTYLCLLRLPEDVRTGAQAENAVWPRSPLPAMKALDIAARFGIDWVIPNSASPNIGRCYLAAFNCAGASTVDSHMPERP